MAPHVAGGKTLLTIVNAHPNCSAHAETSDIFKSFDLRPKMVSLCLYDSYNGTRDLKTLSYDQLLHVPTRRFNVTLRLSSCEHENKTLVVPLQLEKKRINFLVLSADGAIVSSGPVEKFMILNGETTYGQASED